jgi:IS30 family transposase
MKKDAKNSQFNLANLLTMEILMNEGIKVPEIAVRLGKNKTSVYRSIKTNSEADGTFSAVSAWEKIRKRKRLANAHYRILSGSLLAKYIVEKIECYWSPEQIAGTWKLEQQEALCQETVYQFVYRYHPELIKIYFRRKGKKYQHNRKAKYQIKDRVMIDERPKEVEKRKIPGHWEGDTIVGKDHQGAITTNVERKSGFLIASKVDHSTAQEVADVMIEDFSELPEELLVSVTYDNGREFAEHKQIAASTKMTVYFAHAYSPWERGTNENANGLLRQFIPKGTDFSTVSHEDLKHYVDLINNRPRKRHGWKTPQQILSQSLLKITSTKIINSCV